MFSKIKRSSIYHEVQNLKAALVQYSARHEPSCELFFKLHDASFLFIKNSPPKESKNYGKHLERFADECRSLVYEYEPLLLAAPGVINQFLERINIFLRRYDLTTFRFQTEKTNLYSNLYLKGRIGSVELPLEEEEEKVSLSLG